MLADNDKESEAFLQNEDGNSTAAGEPHRRRETNGAKGRTILILQLVLLAANVILLLWNASFAWSGGVATTARAFNDQVQDPFSPARSALRYVIKTIDTHPKHSPFSGPPRAEVDQAWSQLLHGSMVKITDEEMKTMNKTSVALKDGSGYVGYLETYHMLHCVKRLYQAQYPEYYTELASAGKLTVHHLEHCMEVLREGIICNADVAVNTYRWDSTTPDQLQGQNMQPRKCVDWSSLEGWANDRAIGRHHEKLVADGEPGSIGPAELLP